jgi:tRNA pseudouridine38-40 synthase
MQRYFLEVAYKGTHYSGFQVQENANTIQAEIEKAFTILHRSPVILTGSSRTDAGVHAFQNYFHFDFDAPLNPQFIYKMNAILPADIVVKGTFKVRPESHSRFDAVSRKYIYNIHQQKNPFLQETSFFYPFKLDLDLMQQGASLIQNQHNFFAFSKSNTQVKNFQCNIIISEWHFDGDRFYYIIEGNRFLRGMVRLLTGSLLQVGRKKLTLHQLDDMFHQDSKSGFAVPSSGLFLERVTFSSGYFSFL